MIDLTYLVYSREHNSWWRKDGAGYSVVIEGAGRFTKKAATAICKQNLKRFGDSGEGRAEVMMLSPESTEYLSNLTKPCLNISELCHRIDARAAATDGPVPRTFEAATPAEMRELETLLAYLIASLHEGEVQ